MPSEIAIPFRLDPSGAVATLTNPDLQIRQHVMSLINTNPGQRVVMGDYGIATVTLLFEDVDISVADLETRITQEFQEWEPGVLLANVSASEQSDGKILVEVQYSRTDSADTSIVGNNSNTAVIEEGGRVVEVVVG